MYIYIYIQMYIYIYIHTLLTPPYQMPKVEDALHRIRSFQTPQRGAGLCLPARNRPKGCGRALDGRSVPRPGRLRLDPKQIKPSNPKSYLEDSRVQNAA